MTTYVETNTVIRCLGTSLGRKGRELTAGELIAGALEGFSKAWWSENILGVGCIQAETHVSEKEPEMGHCEENIPGRKEQMPRPRHRPRPA